MPVFVCFGVKDHHANYCVDVKDEHQRQDHFKYDWKADGNFHNELLHSDQGVGSVGDEFQEFDCSDCSQHS